jgi:hypothetical protein
MGSQRAGNASLHWDRHGLKLHADLETGTLPGSETGTILSFAHFKLRMRAAIMGACSCSAISAAASSVSLIASRAKGSPFALRLVNAYFLRSSSPKVMMSSLHVQNYRNYIPEHVLIILGYPQPNDAHNSWRRRPSPKTASGRHRETPIRVRRGYYL